jgi:hypothetical protein
MSLIITPNQRYFSTSLNSVVKIIKEDAHFVTVTVNDGRETLKKRSTLVSFLLRHKFYLL